MLGLGATINYEVSARAR